MNEEKKTIQKIKLTCLGYKDSFIIPYNKTCQSVFSYSLTFLIPLDFIPNLTHGYVCMCA